MWQLVNMCCGETMAHNDYQEFHGADKQCKTISRANREKKQFQNQLQKYDSNMKVCHKVEIDVQSDE